MVLDALIGMLWMFGAFFLIWCIIKSTIYDLEEVAELVMQASELMEVLGVLM